MRNNEGKNLNKIPAKTRSIGLLYVPVIPLLLAGALVGSLIYWRAFSLLVFVIGLLGLLYVGLLVTHIEYGPNFIRLVRVPNAPSEIESLLKQTNEEGDLIYVFLLAAFEDEEAKLSKTNLWRWVQKNRNIQLTYQATLTYINKLEEMKLIYSKKVTRDYEFILTETGQWCQDAIKVCFPQTLFWYVLRNYLGKRPLKIYPSRQDIGTEKN